MTKPSVEERLAALEEEVRALRAEVEAAAVRPARRRARYRWGDVGERSADAGAARPSGRG